MLRSRGAGARLGPESDLELEARRVGRPGSLGSMVCEPRCVIFFLGDVFGLYRQLGIINITLGDTRLVSRCRI